MHNYPRIRVGDVGFIRRGSFHLLFSAGCPLGSRQLGHDVPLTFEQLNVGPSVFSTPRAPGCFRTDTIRELLEPSANFSYELTGNRGVALVTKYPTYREDSLLESAFVGYTKRHYESWVKFALEMEYGDAIKPVLVCGFDMTRDFAMVAYSHEGTFLEADLTIAVPPAPASWVSWRTRCSPHTNYGPHYQIPFEAIGSPFSERAETGSIPDEFNQCVFIRYYTMRSRLGMFPKVIRASAGPHDLGSGENRGDTFPELAVQVDDELTTDDEEDPGAQLTPVTDDADSETNIVVPNTPLVWYLLSPKSPL